MKALRWLSARLKDLFYDPTNTKLDVGRVIGVLSALSLIGAAGWNIHLGKEIDLGPAGFAGGLGTLLGAAAIYIIQDRKRVSA